MRVTQAIILAGGLGTRLRLLVRDRPKVLAPIAGSPFLEYVLLQLRNYGIEDVILSVGFRGEMIERHFGNGSKWGLCLRYSYETKPLGTGGAVRLAERLLKGKRLLVMNGDSFFDVDINALWRSHEKRGSVITLALAKVNNPQRYAAVEINRRGEVVMFKEKEHAETAGLVNGGIYVFRREALDLIPEGTAVSLEREVFPRLIRKGLHGVPREGYFVDIGVPADYLQLQTDPSKLLAAVADVRGGTSDADTRQGTFTD